MEGDNSRHRINGALMPNYQGKHVCVLGKAKDVDPNGKFFTLSTSDEKDIRVNMSNPLSEYVSGLTEVHGRVQGNILQCENYVLFSEDAAGKFDMGLYNQAVQLMEGCPEQYVQGVTES
ncbi:replication protein A 14 kDa subunit-like [Littorina saxatilis]|uniref:Replication protein A3 n=1 Tax=Littorina saxatilis TaxID=31220 RepID=A0AAN9GJW6_9CAEN